MNIHRRVSSDGGHTWSAPEDIGVTDQAAHPAVLPDGRTVLAWVDRFQSQSIKARRGAFHRRPIRSGIRGDPVYPPGACRRDPKGRPGILGVDFRAALRGIPDRRHRPGRLLRRFRACHGYPLGRAGGCNRMPIWLSCSAFSTRDRHGKLMDRPGTRSVS